MQGDRIRAEEHSRADPGARGGLERYKGLQTVTLSYPAARTLQHTAPILAGPKGLGLNHNKESSRMPIKISVKKVEMLGEMLLLLVALLVPVATLMMSLVG